jgi:hypothetical protein
MTDSKTLCELDYLLEPISARTVLSTIAIIALAILLELLANGACEDRLAPPAPAPVSAPVQEAHDQQPQSEPQPQASAEQQPQPQPEAAQTENTNEDRPQGGCCPSQVPPLMRANRLVAALFFFIPLVAVFSLRMRDMSTPYIRPECRAYIGPSDLPTENMYGVIPFNVVPFISGCFAVLRALVDVVLVRREAGLGYHIGSKREREWPWLPCMPFTAVIMVGALAWRCLKWPVALLMGRKARQIWGEGEGPRAREDDIEMQGEQRGLLYDVDDNESDGGQEGSAAGLPSYAEVVGPSKKV